MRGGNSQSYPIRHICFMKSNTNMYLTRMNLCKCGECANTMCECSWIIQISFFRLLFWCCLCMFVLRICVRHVYWCSPQDFRKRIEGEISRIRVIKQSLGNAYSYGELLLPACQAELPKWQLLYFLFQIPMCLYSGESPVVCHNPGRNSAFLLLKSWAIGEYIDMAKALLCFLKGGLLEWKL